jgi:hypothetical protein
MNNHGRVSIIQWMASMIGDDTDSYGSDFDSQGVTRLSIQILDIEQESEVARQSRANSWRFGISLKLVKPPSSHLKLVLYRTMNCIVSSQTSVASSIFNLRVRSATVANYLKMLQLVVNEAVINS